VRPLVSALAANDAAAPAWYQDVLSDTGVLDAPELHHHVAAEGDGGEGRIEGGDGVDVVADAGAGRIVVDRALVDGRGVGDGRVGGDSVGKVGERVVASVWNGGQ